MTQRMKGLPGASLRLAPAGSGAPTKSTGTSKRRAIDTGGVPTAMEPLPNKQVSPTFLVRCGCQGHPANCAAKITRMRNAVILNHSCHVALPPKR